MSNNQSVANLHQTKNPLVQQLQSFDKNFQAILEEKSDITITHSKQPSQSNLKSVKSTQNIVLSIAEIIPAINNEAEHRKFESNNITIIQSPAH